MKTWKRAELQSGLVGKMLLVSAQGPGSFTVTPTQLLCSLLGAFVNCYYSNELFQLSSSEPSEGRVWLWSGLR